MMADWHRSVRVWVGLGMVGCWVAATPSYGGDLGDIIRALVAKSGDTSSADEAAFEATHRQTALIKVFDEDEKNTGQLQTFCLNGQGQLLAAVTADPGEIRVFDPQGERVAQWKIPVAPEAINLATDGTILLAGEGEVLRLDQTGNVLARAEAPHVAERKEDLPKLRKQVAEQLRQTTQSFRDQLKQLQDQVRRLKNVTEEQEQELALLREAIQETADRREGDLTDAEREQVSLRRQLVRSITDSMEAQVPARNRAMVARLNTQIEAYERYLEKNGGEPTEAQIDQRLRAARRQKRAVSSISATEEEVFLATPAAAGFGFAVWRTNQDFGEAEEIVSGLRGCCGQMDVQASDQGVYVAENARHRVCQYDREGTLVHSWGKRARQGVRGFGGCCNPMNVAFGTDGSVYAAESSTGRIKRYSPEGELTELIGAVELVPGCKKVSIAVSDDGQRVYMLDITRNHIVVMERAEVTAPDQDALVQE